ncbi:MAG TPA: hypothetical protein DCE42_20490 [Myxococcales bacterium]|nr:hypothetical protein [Myxococcales bacterium]
MKAYIITDGLAYMEKEYKEQGCMDHAEAIHQAISIIRSASHDDDDPISEPARGQLFPLMKRASVSLDDLKGHLLKHYGICSTKAIPWGLYDEVCDWLVAKDPQRKFQHKQVGEIFELPTLEELQAEPTQPQHIQEPLTQENLDMDFIDVLEDISPEHNENDERTLEFFDEVEFFDELDILDELELMDNTEQIMPQQRTNDPVMQPRHRRRRPKKRPEHHQQHDQSTYEF